jgi:hypothetical protein
MFYIGNNSGYESKFYKNYNDLLLKFLLFETNNFRDSKGEFNWVDDLLTFNKFTGFFFNIKLITKAELINFLLFWGVDAKMLSNDVFLNNLLFCFRYFKNEVLIVYFMLNISISELYYIYSNVYLTKVCIYQMCSKLNKSLEIEIIRFYLLFFFNNNKKYKICDFKKFKQVILSELFFFDTNDNLFFYKYLNSFTDLDFYGETEKLLFIDVFFKRVTLLEIFEYLIDNFIYNLHNYVNIKISYQFTFSINTLKYLYLKNNFYNFKEQKSTFLYNIYSSIYIYSIVHEMFCFFRFHLLNFFYLSKNRFSRNYIYKYYKIFKFRFFLLLDFVQVRVPEIVSLCLIFYNFIRLLILKIRKVKINQYLVLFNILNLLFFRLFHLIKFQLIYQKISSLNIFKLININIFKFFGSTVGFGNSNFILFNNINYSEFNYFDLLKRIIGSSFFLSSFKLFNFYYFFFKKEIFFTIISSYFSKNLRLKNFVSCRTLYLYNNFSESMYNIEFFNFNSLYRLFFLTINYSLFKVLYEIYWVTSINLYMPLKLRIKAQIENFFFFLSEEVLVEDFTLLLDDFRMDEFFDPDAMESETYHEDANDYLYDAVFGLGGDDGLYFDEFFFSMYVDEVVSINYYRYEVFLYKYISQSEISLCEIGINTDYDYQYNKLSPFFDRSFIYLNDYEYGGFLEKNLDANTWYNWVSSILIGELSVFMPNSYQIPPTTHLLKSSVFDVLLYGEKYQFNNLAFHHISIDFKIKFFLNFNKKLNIYELVFLYNVQLNDLFVYEIFENENYYSDILNYDGNIIVDANLLMEYSCFTDFFKKWFIVSAVKETNILNIIFPFIFGDSYETGVRDLVLLHEIWIWWEYISRSYSRNRINKLLMPTTFEELLFLNSYILSGLSGIINLDNKSFKLKFFELFEEKTNLNNVINEIYFFINKDLKKMNNVTFDIETRLYPNRFIQKIEFYYINMLYIYNELIFNNNYFDLYNILYEYNIIVYKKKKVHVVLFNLIKRLEYIYFFLLKNLFKTLINSFYLNGSKDNLLYFWETFFLTIIETCYSFVDLYFYDDNKDNFPFHWYNNMYITNLTRMMEILVFEDLDLYNMDFNLNYLNKIFLLYTNPYNYIAKGLNINYSMAEVFFFDLYETFMINFTDVEQLNVNMSLLTQTKFFEPEMSELYNFDRLAFNHLSANETEFMAVVQSEEDIGNFETLEVQAYNAVDFSNYFLGEDYFQYLSRYNDIKNLVIFFMGAFNRFVSKSSLICEFLSLFKLNSKLSSSNNVQVLLFINKHQYNCELIYYYIFCMFFSKNKISNFNFKFLKIFFFFFIFFFKNLKISYYYHFFFIQSYSSLFLYFIFKYLKGYYKINFTYKNILNYIIKIFYKILLESSLIEFYKLLKYLYIKIYEYIQLLLKSINFYVYKNIFYKKFIKLINYFYKSSLLYYLYVFFLKKTFEIRFTLDESLLINSYNVQKSSFRSFLSTMPIYMSFDFKKHLIIDHLIFFYFFKFKKKELGFNRFMNDNVKLINFSDYYYYQFYNGEINKNYDLKIISLVDSNLIDLFDSVKDGTYFDYEDFEDDGDLQGDEWSYELNIGDLSDDLIEDVDYAEIGNNEETLELEELNMETDIDKSLVFLYDENIDNFNSSHMTTKFSNLVNFRSYREYFFINQLYYKSLVYFRSLLINLFKLYQQKVASSTFVHLYTNSLYSTKEELTQSSNFLSKVTPIKLLTLYKNSSFVNKVLKYSNDQFINLIPKYMYTYHIYDIFDYFFDYNQTVYSEANTRVDIFVNIFNSLNMKFTKSDLLMNDQLIKLLKFFSFLYLYRSIYQYFDTHLVKVNYISLYFFDLICMVRRFYLKFFYFINKNFQLLKFIYDKVYNFMYLQLKKFLIYRNDFLQKDSSDLILNFFNIMYQNIPFYFFNYKFFLKKIYILKSIFGNRFTLFSYFILIKACEWFFSNCKFYKKQDFFRFFYFIMKKLYCYESLLFFNNYKIIQVYYKYGLIESFYFFEKNICLSNFETYIKTMQILYKSSEIFLFFYEFVVYLFVFFILLLFLVNISNNFWIIKPFNFRKYQISIELRREDYEHNPEGAALFFNSNTYDLIMYYFIHGHIFDLWGIF